MHSAPLKIDLGGEALKIGSAYVNRAFVGGFALDRLRRYFLIDNAYVASKVRLVLFPYGSAVWQSGAVQKGAPSGMCTGYASYAGEDEGGAMPLAMPDMYIPAMALATYILLLGAEMGLRRSFQPERLGILSSRLVLVGAAEIALVKLAGFFLDANELEALDMLAFLGYKYVPAVALKLSRPALPALLWRALALYLYVSFFFFLVRSLKSFLLVGNSVLAARQRRIYFLFLIVLVDVTILCMLR